MSLAVAVRLTEILLALSFIQQSIEHLCCARRDRILFFTRLVLSVLLISGIFVPWVCVLLLINGILFLRCFQGPYNGGADRMNLLVLFSLVLVYFMPSAQLQGYVFGYLALQTILSYFLAGYYKVVNSEWWNGQVLQDVFLFSAFPASENLRSLAARPKLLCVLSWLVILFELLFPFALLNQTLLLIALLAAISFHIANAYFFGFNRFIWAWLAAYPSIVWLQGQL